MHPKIPGRHIYTHCQQKTGVMILSKFNFKMSYTINFKVVFVKAHTLCYSVPGSRKTATQFLSFQK